MGQQTTTIATVRFFRQDDPPPSAPDGATWVTASDGAGNDTSSRYNYDAAAERWELESAVGPSEPTLGAPIAGSSWRDTSVGEPKQYDGSAWLSLVATSVAGNFAGANKDFSRTYTNNSGAILFAHATARIDSATTGSVGLRAERYDEGSSFWRTVDRHEFDAGADAFDYFNVSMPVKPGQDYRVIPVDGSVEARQNFYTVTLEI